MASLTVRARDKLQPALYADIANGGILDAYLSGLVYPLQEVEDYAADSDDGPGWSIVLDLSRAPDKLMPWLSQFVGVDATIPSGQTPDQIRQAITDRPNWKRGTPAAMAAAAQLYLTGSKIVVFRERDTSPYHFTVMTYANETRRFNGDTAAATLSGNLITDAVRAANTSGDGRGYTAVTNIMPNGDFEVNITGWGAINGTPTRVSEDKQFGSWSMKMVAAGGSTPYVYFANFVTGAPIPRTTFTVSMWVKAIGSAIGKQAQIQVNEFGGAVAAQAPVYAQFILDGTWQKLVATGTMFQSDRTALILYFFTNTSVASAGETVYIDGIQIEQGSVAHDFVSTNGAVATAMQGAPDSSIGIWEATTNLIPNGGFETNLTGWTGFNVALTRDTSRSKFGTASMRGTATAAGGTEFGYCSVAGLTIGQSYTLSGWIWIPSSWPGSNGVVFQFANAGNPAGYQAVANMALRDQWQRVSTTFIATQGTGTPAWRAPLFPSVGDSLWFDGLQLENKNLPTPYVDTSAATASRATAGRIQLPASLLSSVQGWVAMRLRMGWPSTADSYSNAAFRLFWWGDSGSDRLLAYYRVTNDTFGLQSAVGGVLAETASVTQVFAAGDKKTVIYAWTANTISVSVDGSNFFTFPRASGGPIALSTFDLGAENGVLQADCDYLWAAGGIGALTNADVATIAAIGDADPDIPSLPVNGIPTFTWKANDANYILPVTDTRVIEAINAVKPAGLQFTYSVLSGQDYTSLLTNHPLYSNVFADYATYHGLVIDRPGT